MKKQKSTKKLTLIVGNPLIKGQEKKMIENLSNYIQKLYYS